MAAEELAEVGRPHVASAEAAEIEAIVTGNVKENVSVNVSASVTEAIATVESAVTVASAAETAVTANGIATGDKRDSFCPSSSNAASLLVNV